MNRRDILSSLASWATAASAVAESQKVELPTVVDGWPTKRLPDDTSSIAMDVEVAAVPPERTLLVFRLTTCIPSERVEDIRDNLRKWVRSEGLDCAAVLLPYGLELDVHRIAAGTSPADVSVSPKE